MTVRTRWTILIVIILGATGFGLCKNAGLLLVRNNIEPHAASYSVALILMGSVIERAKVARDLFKTGKIDRIVFFKTEVGESEMEGLADDMGTQTLRFLTRHGVPDERIAFIKDSAVTSTLDEARALHGWLQSNAPGERRILVITSWYHTRRAGWIFERVFRSHGVTVDLAPGFGKSDPAHWWRHEDDFLSVFTEYLKFLYFFLFVTV